LNGYGESSHWSPQSKEWFTLISFLNVTKYPMSLLFALMTLGPIFILLAALENVEATPNNPFLIFGRTPLFYFLLHFLLIHIAALIMNTINTGHSLASIDFHFAKSFGGITPAGGTSLAGTYLAWAVLVVVLYPICRWYDRYKSTHSQQWLSYL